MTNSRSTTSINSWLAAIVAMFVVWASPADAGGRKRVVVLEFEGAKAEKFHDDVVKMLKKNHTVVSAEKWNGVAEEMDAGKITEKNVKKIARKLKIDGVITGKIEKRRDEYIVQLKLRAGATGEIVGNRVDTKADGPRLDGKAARDLKEELLPEIDDLEANHGGGGDDDEQDTKPVKKKRGSDEGDDEADARPTKKRRLSDDEQDKPVRRSKKSDDEEDRPVKKSKKSDDEQDKPVRRSKKSDDEDQPKRSGFGKRDDEARGSDRVGNNKDDEEDVKPVKKSKKDDERKRKTDDEESPASSAKHDEDDTPLPKTKPRPKSADDDNSDEDNPKKKVAKADEEDTTSTEAEAEPVGEGTAASLSPSQRAVDLVVGLSFVARRLSFRYDADLAMPPPGYKQSVPVAGALVDATVFPLSMGHKRHDLLAGLGFSIMYDKVLKITSQKKFAQMDGTMATANIATSEQKFGIGAVFRYPLGKGGSAPVVGGKLGYISQAFEIGQTLPNGQPVDIPSVAYSIIELGGLFRYPISSQIILDADASLLLVAGTGDISKPEQFGKASVLGLQFAGGLDYLITKSLFVRGLFRIERIGYSFAGGAKQTNMRDGDPAQDVQGATDMYYGITTTVGYLY